MEMIKFSLLFLPSLPEWLISLSVPSTRAEVLLQRRILWSLFRGSSPLDRQLRGGIASRHGFQIMTNQRLELRNTCQQRLLQGDQLFNRISLYFRERFILNVVSAFMIHPSQLRHQLEAYLWCCFRVKWETARNYFKKVAFPGYLISNFLRWENTKLKTLVLNFCVWI